MKTQNRKQVVTVGVPDRKALAAGDLVDIVLKQDQRTGKLTRGHIKRFLTKSPSHPHGIKVMLEEDDQVGRVQAVHKQA